MELENEIFFMGRPLGQALLSAAGNKTGIMPLLAKRIDVLLRDLETPVNKAWEAGLAEFRDKWVLHQEEWDLLLSMGEVLGKTDRAGQKAYIELIREKFGIQEKKAENERAKKEKLYKNLGALGGLATVLVLI